MRFQNLPTALASSERFVVFLMPDGMGLEISDAATRSLGWIPKGEYCNLVISSVREMDAKMKSGEMDEEAFDDSIDSIVAIKAPASVN